MQLSSHFNSAEFACNCGCGYGTNPGDVSDELLIVLEDLRAHYGGQPVVLNSGCRCKKHNAAVGGASSSQHLLGTAADLNISRQSPRAVANYLESRYPDKYGVGRYASFTHVDVRRNKARWGSN